VKPGASAVSGKRLGGTVSICLYTDRFLPIVGGAELLALRMAQRLAGEGTARFLVVTRRHDPSWPRREDLGGIVVHRLPPRGLGKWAELSFAFRSLRFLLKRRREFDLVHFLVVSFPNSLVALVMKLAGKRVVVKIATAGVLGRGHFLVRPFRNAILRRMDGFIALSEEISREYTRYRFEPGRIHLIPNGVDADRFHPLPAEEKVRRRAELGLPGRGPLCLFAGRISREKGPHLLLESWRAITPEYPDVMLALVGSGRFQKNSVETEIREMLGSPETRELARRVIWVGEVQDLAPYLQAADLFVLPSLRDGLPNALLEAMATGLSVVASRLPGVVEALGEGGAMFVPPGDPGALARGLGAALSDPDFLAKAGRKNRERVIQWYSLEKVAGAYFRMYLRIIRPGPQP